MIQIQKKKQKTSHAKAPRTKKATILNIKEETKVYIKQNHLLAQQLCIEKKEFTSTIINGVSVHKTLYGRYYMLINNTISGPFTIAEYYNQMISRSQFTIAKISSRSHI